MRKTYQRAGDLPGVRAERLPTGRALTRRELQKLFQACASGDSLAGRRVAALLAVLHGPDCVVARSWRST
jgi:hypothetical protein